MINSVLEKLLMNEPVLPRLLRLTARTWTWSLFCIIACTLTSCSSPPPPKSAEGDIVSLVGYSIHFKVEVANTSLDPLGYVITLKNQGLKSLTFKPSVPGCMLYLDPDKYTSSIFQEEVQTSFTATQKATVVLAPGDTTTLQLPIQDLASDLRGGVHECQLAIRPETPQSDTKSTEDFGEPKIEEPLRSKTFRIFVP